MDNQNDTQNDNQIDIQAEIDDIDKKIHILLRDINDMDADRDSHWVSSRQRKLEKELNECCRRKKELQSKIKE
jgi:hypothetical protein